MNSPEKRMCVFWKITKIKWFLLTSNSRIRNSRSSFWSLESCSSCCNWLHSECTVSTWKVEMFVRIGLQRSVAWRQTLPLTCVDVGVCVFHYYSYWVLMVMLLYLLQELLVSPQEQLLFLHPLRVLLKCQIRGYWALALTTLHLHTAHYQKLCKSMRITKRQISVNYKEHAVQTKKHTATMGSVKE